MSQTNTVEPPEQEDDATPTEQEIERVARANGWKPKDQWKRAPDDWVDAKTFVQRGIESPAVLARQNKVLVDKITNLEETTRTARSDAAAIRQQLNDAVTTVGTMTEMMRKSEERAYARARRELKEEQAKAVESGDTAKFRQVETQLEALDRDKPEVVAPRTQTPTPPPAQQNQPPPNVHPAIRDFWARNQWYDPSKTRADRDEDMMEYADRTHIGLQQTRPNLTMEQNLAEVEREVRMRFPGKFGQQGLGGNNRQQQQTSDDDDDTGRRNDPPMTTPNSGATPPPRQRGARRGFDAMPKESRDAYERYKKMIDSQREQKGQHIAALTKDEWAQTYWEQFQDDGT
jgi:hypothetical protein